MRSAHRGATSPIARCRTSSSARSRSCTPWSATSRRRGCNAKSARAVLRDLGQAVRAASSSLDVAIVELLAGDPAAAEREIRPDCEMLQGMGETYFLSSMAITLARAVLAQGRDEEALTWIEHRRKVGCRRRHRRTGRLPMRPGLGPRPQGLTRRSRSAGAQGSRAGWPAGDPGLERRVTLRPGGRAALMPKRPDEARQALAEAPSRLHGEGRHVVGGRAEKLLLTIR